MSRVGIFPQMPEAEYRELQAANWSTLKHFRRSPAHVKFEMDSESKPSFEQNLGTIQHMAICEPAKFVNQYFVLPEFQWNSKQAKENAVSVLTKAEVIPASRDPEELLSLRKSELLEVLCEGGRKPIEQDVYQTCREMSRAIWANKFAKKLLEGCTLTEASMLWNDSATGVYCKGRVDLYHERLGYLIDLKTTDNASFYAFRASVERFGYAPQLAHYKNGLEALGKKVKQVILLAVENRPPYGVAIYALSEGAINTSKVLLEEYLRRWQYCLQTDSWPSYQQEPQDMDLSERGYNQLEAL